jgi:hypothetical protein
MGYGPNLILHVTPEIFLFKSLKQPLIFTPLQLYLDPTADRGLAALRRPDDLKSTVDGSREGFGSLLLERVGR